MINAYIRDRTNKEACMRPHYDIVEIIKVIGYEKVNEYLRKGWVLISTHNASGEAEAGVPNPPLLYVLGWPRKNDTNEEPRE
jgi:hypothetical protein